MCKDSMSSYDDYTNDLETNNIAYGEVLSLDTNTDDLSTDTSRVLKTFETARQQTSCETVQNKFKTIQKSGQR